MTRILICDDSFEDLQSLSAIIDCFYKGSANGGKTTAYSLAKFYDPREAAAFIEDGNEVDIAILDIIMPQMNGMELAAKMREMGFNGYLLFLSSSNDFAAQSYGVKTFSYILKPTREQQVFELLSDIEKKRSNSNRSGFMLSHKGVTRLVTWLEFMYVEVKSHQLFFHLINGEIITIYAALKDYSEKLLSQSHNIRPHKSFIVNLDYIRSCENSAVCMRDGIPSFISVFYFVFIILYNAEMQKQANLQREHDLAKEIIASRRGYYEHLTDITEQTRILRHDYKYHLLSMQKLFEDGYADEAREYLAKLNANTINAPLHDYCRNRVLNALLSGFAERCEKEQISFTVKIELQPSISDYEMCIITGNLLDNAVTACKRTPEGKKRYIELRMHRHDDNFGFMVENSFDGGVNQNGDKLVSAKKDGGFGINSIISIISRHNGEYTPVWDEEKFKAFVIIKD